MSILLSTHRYWQFAVNGLGFLSFFANFHTANKSPGLLAGFDSFYILSKTQVKPRF